MMLFRHEWAKGRKSFFLWTISTLLTLGIFLFMYPSIIAEKEAYEEILSVYPREILKAFSIQLDTLLSFHGFLGYVYGYILLALCIYAMLLGLKAFGQEITSLTADFLFTKPMKRARIYLEKVLFGCTNLLLLNGSLFLVVLVLEYTFTKTLDINTTFMMLFTSFLLQILFYFMGLLLGILRRKIRYFTTMAISIVSGFYLVSMMSQLTERSFLRIVSPFGYFDHQQLLQKGAYEGSYFLLTLSLILFFLLTTHLALEKKEFPS